MRAQILWRIACIDNYRKTGITLEDRGVRDEHGLEPISGIFSSPEKSPPKRASNRSGDTLTESESMELTSTCTGIFMRNYAHVQHLQDFSDRNCRPHCSASTFRHETTPQCPYPPTSAKSAVPYEDFTWFFPTSPIVYGPSSTDKPGLEPLSLYVTPGRKPTSGF